MDGNSAGHDRKGDPMRTATPTTPALVADICLYGTHTTGAGYLGLIAPAAAPMLARDEAMFGTGEPVAGRSFTEAVFAAVTVLRDRGVVAGVARIFEPSGERVAVVNIAHAIPDIRGSGVAPGAGVSLRRAAAGGPVTRRAFVDVGTRVARKRDGALGTITNRTAVIVAALRRTDDAAARAARRRGRTRARRRRYGRRPRVVRVVFPRRAAHLRSLRITQAGRSVVRLFR